MAFAITGYKAWGIETSKAISPEVVQYLELTFTATNADIAWDLGTAAGTFWTSAGATTIPAAAKKIMYDACLHAEYALPTGGTITGLYSKAAAAAATTYVETAGTVTNSLDLLFNAGNGPTAGKMVYSWKMKPDYVLLTANS